MSKENTSKKNTLVIGIDTTEIDIAMEKVNKLKSLLIEVDELVSSLNPPKVTVFEGTEDAEIEKYRCAIKKYGVPEKVYIDNPDCQ